MAAQVRLNGAGVRELLHSEGVRRMLRARAERAAAAARASAPVASGAYRDSIRVEDATTDRAVGRVVADVPYAPGGGVEDGEPGPVTGCRARRVRGSRGFAVGDLR
jgi:hypothetical protein